MSLKWWTERQPQQTSLEKIREVLTIIGRSHLVGQSCSARDKYAKDAKTTPMTQVYKTEERPTKYARRELEDIVFTEGDARWVHHPHANAFVITTWISNRIVHRLMVDDGSAVDIVYLDAYKQMRLAKNALSLATSPLYRFTGDHIIPKGTASLAVTVGEQPRTSTVIADFLVVDCLSAINRIIERPQPTISPWSSPLVKEHVRCEVVSMIQGSAIINLSKWQKKTANCQVWEWGRLFQNHQRTRGNRVKSIFQNEGFMFIIHLCTV